MPIVNKAGFPGRNIMLALCHGPGMASSHSL
jgi:hypothetical protein